MISMISASAAEPDTRCYSCGLLHRAGQADDSMPPAITCKLFEARHDQCRLLGAVGEFDSKLIHILAHASATQQTSPGKTWLDRPGGSYQGDRGQWPAKSRARYSRHGLFAAIKRNW